MPITRKFLGFDRPPLQLAADFLIERFRRGVLLDMAAAIVVLPGAQAGRRLLEILVERAEQQELVLTPPLIETVGRLPENLYQPQRPFAGDLVQQLVWAETLEAAADATLRKLVANPPGRNESARWLELGELLKKQHTELAADGMDFADVAERLKADPASHPRERERWLALSEIQQAYLRRLDGLLLWDIQTARLVAIKQRECRTDRDIVLVGAADLNITLRQMLDQVAEQVTALVFAPPAWSRRFDEHGCLVPAAWEHAEISLDDSRVHLVEGPAEQADTVARCLADYAGAYRADEITVGLPDEQITPHVQRRLQQCGIPARSAAGIPLAETRPYRLLAAAAEFLATERFHELAALVRHPDVSRWLDSPKTKVAAEWLEQLDDFRAEQLPAGLSDMSEEAARRYPAAVAACRAIQRLLKPFAGGERPLGDWPQTIFDLLLKIFGDRRWNRDEAHDRTVLQAIEKLQAAAATFAAELPADLAPSVAADEAIRLLLDQVAGDAVVAPADEAAVELLGWLELPLDDAPAAIVCSFNEGSVPSSVNADLFLPNSLRVMLGLQDNLRRYARDVYALSLLAATRQRLDLIVARRNMDDDPLAPSRLLFACNDATLIDRVTRFFRPASEAADQPPLAGVLRATRERATFRVPRPRPLAEPIEELAVTSFRSYLACPYRFYLSRVLQLQVAFDDAAELDGAAFGNLLHEVLRQFGAGDRRDSTSADDIRGWLDSLLETVVAETFGGVVLPAVQLQIEQLRGRLHVFAEQQAQRAAAGWRIEFTEIPTRDHPPAEFVVDERPMRLRGRIDRIDRHAATGEYAILDYKSSDSARTPEQVHVKSNEWVDLQLPMYRHLIRGLGIDGPVQLGYVLLPKDTAAIGFHFADWTPADLASADEVAARVIRSIRQEIFWPPTDPPPDYSEEFAAICMDGVFERNV